MLNILTAKSCLFNLNRNQMHGVCCQRNSFKTQEKDDMDRLTMRGDLDQKQEDPGGN